MTVNISKKDFERYFIKPSKTIYPLSGWKIFITGECEEDSTLIKFLLEEIVMNYGLSWKLSKEESFEVRNKKKLNQFKACTIYFPFSLIKEGKQIEVVELISSSLKKGNYNKDLNIFGAKKIRNSIYYRYDCDIPMMEGGFSREDYLKHYKKSSSNFNIKNNKDLF
ncbi:MAG: hypothetical protein KC516_03515 [Nanoarchaeota archaeon]|nr:hypothetical protein [Nanoarchaeota archaeon]